MSINMSLELKLSEAIKQAMRDKNRIALDALRAVKAALLNLKSEQKGAELSLEQEIAILQRMVKQRKESAEQFTAQNRQDLVEVELAQAKEIEVFLPQQLSPEALEAAIKAVIAQTGASSLKDLGQVMAAANQALAGQSDGKSISLMAKQLLA
jgi:uncharacterized protein